MYVCVWVCVCVMCGEVSAYRMIEVVVTVQSHCFTLYCTEPVYMVTVNFWCR